MRFDNDDREALGIWECPNCNETYDSIDEVEVWGKRESDFPDLDGEYYEVTVVICPNCHKNFDWEENEHWT